VAGGSRVEPSSGVASSLVEYGIPAVVGMQFEISDEAAITFAGRLYSAIAHGFPIYAAMAAIASDAQAVVTLNQTPTTTTA
jgi:CHAT domain